ncbi:hypothetical protein ABT186_31170 [Streptomyces sp. NPDC001634]|uniref:hypothetical protein n=1 Tax=Streptomyces sp. NPDC001634 TaxID=3154390 RepID=UPI00332201A2
MTRDEITRLVHSISDLAAVIRQDEPEDKAEIYLRLGLQLTYTAGQQTVRAEIAPDPNDRRNKQSPRSQRDRGEMVGGWCPRGELTADDTVVTAQGRLHL